MIDVTTQIRRDALQATDRDRFVLDPRAAAHRLTWSIARPTQNAGKDVRLPVEHVRFGVLSVRYQTDVLRHVGMRGTSPLAVDHLVIVVGVPCIRRLHQPDSSP